LDIDKFLWIVLAVTIGTVLTLDLLVFNRRAHAPSFREAATFSAFYIALGLVFGALVFRTRGAEDGTAYLAGYLLELSLSVDNVFVFALIFAAIVVPLKYQHRVLFYGILGAIVFRAIFIGLGAAIIETFHWAIYVFGVLLLYTGYRMWAQRNEHMIDPENNRLLRLFRRFVPTTDGYRGQKFIVHEGGRRLATPCWPCWSLSSPATSCSPSTPCRRSSRSRPTRSSCSARMPSRSWACARCTSCWPARSTSFAISSPVWPRCSSSPG
jgi:tellurite resistance protein TerC